MRERFDIQLDYGQRLVFIRTWDYWSDADAELYRVSVYRLIEDLRRSPRPYDVICDVSRSPPQSARVEAVRRETLAHAFRSGMRRFAFVASDVLIRQQMGRISQPFAGAVRFFPSFAEAEGWLRGVDTAQK